MNNQEFFTPEQEKRIRQIILQIAREEKEEAALAQKEAEGTKREILNWVKEAVSAESFPDA